MRLPLPTLLFFLLLLFCGVSSSMLLTLLCALLHELGHWGAARLCGVTVRRMVIYPLGADIVLAEEGRSYRKDAFIAFAGAGVNLLLAALGALLGGAGGSFLCACNLFLAAVNLMPIRGLDGGMILSSLCAMRLSPSSCERILTGCSFLCLFFLYLVGVYFLLLAEGDPSLFLIVCFLFASLFLSGKGKGREGKK